MRTVTRKRYENRRESDGVETDTIHNIYELNGEYMIYL